MFLMFRLHRPDVLPVGDLGIVTAVQKAYGLRKRPTPDRLRKLGDAWKPYRSIACWYLWRSLDNQGAAARLQREDIRETQQSEVAMNEGSGGLGAVSIGISEPIVLIFSSSGGARCVRRVEAVEADSGGDRGLSSPG